MTSSEAHGITVKVVDELSNFKKFTEFTHVYGVKFDAEKFEELSENYQREKGDGWKVTFSKSKTPLLIKEVGQVLLDQNNKKQVIKTISDGVASFQTLKENSSNLHGSGQMKFIYIDGSSYAHNKRKYLKELDNE